MKMISNIMAFVVSFGFLSFFSWSMYTITLSQLANIERAFGLTSSESGWILTMWEVGYVVCITFASYFAPRAHIPRVMGVSAILCGLSGFVFALPHFVAYKHSNSGASTENNTSDDMTNIDLCVKTGIGNRTAEQEESEAEKIANFSRKTLAYALLNVGMALQGISKAPCYPYSSQYVDDNGDKKKTGFYVALMSCIGIFGLALGYGAGSGVSNVYVTLEDTDLDPTDTSYIGAWWLAMVAVSASVLLVGLPMFWFPRRIKPIEPAIEQSLSHKRKMTDIKQELKQMATTLLTIVKSPVYTMTLLSACLQVLSFACFLGFEPKYMTTQFSITPWKVNIILGVCSILAYSVGCLIGGFITKRWNMTPFQSLLMVIISLILVLVFLVINTFLGCRQPDVYNIPSSLEGQSTSIDCDCSTSEFTPICGDDGNNYFSPCHAGCSNGTSKIFADCSAIAEGGAKSGLCPSNCNMVWYYSVVKFLMNTIDAIASIPMFLVFLRSAGEEHKSLALGLSAALSALVGWVPGPIIGGKIVDGTCIFWNTASTSTKYCSFYNIEALRFRLHGNMIGLRIASLLLMCVALYKARKLSRWVTDTDKDVKEKETEVQLMVQPGEKINNRD